jgi:hypothetical protein
MTKSRSFQWYHPKFIIKGLGLLGYIAVSIYSIKKKLREFDNLPYPKGERDAG